MASKNTSKSDSKNSVAKNEVRIHTLQIHDALKKMSQIQISFHYFLFILG